MAGQARYTALLDACVLYPLAMADALMSVATAGLYSARWSTRVELEWIRALERDRPDLVGRLGVRRDCMREACPDWQVKEDSWSPLVEGLSLPDKNDRHVLAAAIAGHADCIVTSNVRDFPTVSTEPFGIDVVDPDTFLLNQWDLQPELVIASFREMRKRWRRPECGPEEFVDALARGGLPRLAERLRSAAQHI